MKIAIPQWQGRVSPVFDVASTVMLADVEDARPLLRETVQLQADSLRQRALALAELGVGVLICGAVSRPLELALTHVGIEVIPQTCGEVEEVLLAYTDGSLLKHGRFLMPGCCGRRGIREQTGTGGQPLAGQCVCAACGFTKEHTPGEPCNQLLCPNCGIGLTRPRK